MTCRKRKHKSEQSAWFLAARTVRYSPSGRLRAYRCNLCGYWHVTKQAKRVKAVNPEAPEARP